MEKQQYKIDVNKLIDFLSTKICFEDQVSCSSTLSVEINYKIKINDMIDFIGQNSEGINKDLIFKIKGNDLVSVVKKAQNIKLDPDNIITSQPIPVRP